METDQRQIRKRNSVFPYLEFVSEHFPKTSESSHQSTSGWSSRTVDDFGNFRPGIYRVGIKSNLCHNLMGEFRIQMYLINNNKQ